MWIEKLYVARKELYTFTLGSVAVAACYCGFKGYCHHCDSNSFGPVCLSSKQRHQPQGSHVAALVGKAVAEQCDSAAFLAFVSTDGLLTWGRITAQPGSGGGGELLSSSA